MTERQHVFRDASIDWCSKYGVRGDAAKLFVSLGEAVDAADLGFEMVVLVRAYVEMKLAIQDVYRPRTRQEAELEHMIAREELLSDTGIDFGPWQGGDD